MRTNTGRRGKRLVCMVADDHADMLASLASVLTHEGLMVVESVATGREAVAALRAHRPHVAVLDVRLDDMTAIDVAREAAQLGLETAIVIHTAEASRALVQEALASGVRAVARKSVPPSSLLAAIATVARGGIYVDPAFPAPPAGELGVQTESAAPPAKARWSGVVSQDSRREVPG
jgi:DNA-binding NarL/FixJ family response regulator